MDNVIVEKHDVIINDRTHINMTGIRKIISFDSEEFILDSSLGNLVIKGSQLEVIKLNTTDGNLTLKGKISSLNYIDDNNKKNNESFFSKLFK